MPRNPHISKLPYPAETLGQGRVETDACAVAGSMTTVRITYTAGKFGIDDEGSLRFLLRFASDADRPQFHAQAGELALRVRVFRLPDVTPHRSFAFEREVDVTATGNSPFYVRVTLENGHQAWSSPIHLFRHAWAPSSALTKAPHAIAF